MEGEGLEGGEKCLIKPQYFQGHDIERLRSFMGWWCGGECGTVDVCSGHMHCQMCTLASTA